MTTTALSLAEQKLLDGRSYTVSHNTDLAQDAAASVLIENPSDSGVGVVIAFGDVSHEGETECAVYTDVSSISGGASEDIASNNVGDSESSDVTSTTDASYSTTDEHHRVVYTGTGTERLFDGYKMIVQPGHNIVVELTNPQSNNDQVGIRLSWAEKPE